MRSLFSRIRHHVTWRRFFVVATLVCFAGLYLFLLSKTFHIDQQGVMHSSYFGYGDIPYHMTQVSKFAYSSFNLSDSIYYGDTLRYPFTINLLSGLLLKLTSSWTFAMHAPVMLFALINVALVFWVMKKLLKSSAWALVAFFIFFLGAGTAGVHYVAQNIDRGIPTIVEEVRKGDMEPVITYYGEDLKVEHHIGYLNPLQLVFMHQRTFIIGLTSLLIFAALLMRLHEKRKWHLAIAAGVLLGVMPIIHTHSFVAASILFGFYCIGSAMRRQRAEIKKTLAMILISLPIALPLLYFLMLSNGEIHSQSFGEWRLGWMVQPGFHSIEFPPDTKPSMWTWQFVEFLWFNFGLYIPLFTAGGVLLIRKRMKTAHLDPYLVVAACSAVALFVLGNVYRFQPWDFDNNKIFIYFAFFAAPVVAYALQQVVKKKRYIGYPVTVVALAGLLTGGILHNISPLLAEYKHLPVIFDTDAQKVAAYIRETVPENKLVVTGDTHRNLVASLAGRPVLVGYPGWLWTHGINYGPRADKIKHFYQNPTLENLATFQQQYPVGYMLIDWSAKEQKPDIKLIQKLYPKAFEAGEYSLYQLDGI